VTRHTPSPSPTANAQDVTAKHTPGPWRWFGNRSGGVYLATTHSGRRYVMGFQRYGMNGAQPSFCIGSIMHPASELVQFEVGERAVRGFKDAQKDGSVYRYDVNGIDSADARLIAAAPDLFEALQWALSELRGATRYDNPQQALNCFDKADAAIAKATAA
jgi:hypothetical protein